MNNQASLARKNLEKRLQPLRANPPVAPGRGWTRAIRDALGMTVRQLAARMRVAPSRITAIEQAEVTGAITLRTLRETAAAMDCMLVYAFVPIKPLDEILEDQVAHKIERDLVRLDHTMRLENQALTAGDVADARQRLVGEALRGSLRGVWDA